MVDNIKTNEELTEEVVSSEITEEVNNSEVKVDAKTTDIEHKTIYEMLEADTMNSDLPLKEKNKRLSKLIRMREKQVNILLVGSTGSGKSSTVNALFNMEVAKVGVGVDPETDKITSYTLSNLIIWDSSVEITLNRYVHSSFDQKREYMKRIQMAF